MKISKKLKSLMSSILSANVWIMAIMLIAVYSLFSYLTGMSERKIETLTDLWIKEVTLNHDPVAIQEFILFRREPCRYGIASKTDW